MKVITYSSDRGKIDLTLAQCELLSAAGVWPRDPWGQEYCQVSHGLHSGGPTYTEIEIERLIEDPGSL